MGSKGQGLGSSLTLHPYGRNNPKLNQTIYQRIFVIRSGLYRNGYANLPMVCHNLMLLGAHLQRLSQREIW